jgi:hypothetical protein
MSGAEAAELILQLVEPSRRMAELPRIVILGSARAGLSVARSPTDTIRVLTLEEELARLFSAVLRRGASAHFGASSCAACLAISGGVL